MGVSEHGGHLLQMGVYLLNRGKGFSFSLDENSSMATAELQGKQGPDPFH